MAISADVIQIDDVSVTEHLQCGNSLCWLEFSVVDDTTTSAAFKRLVDSLDWEGPLFITANSNTDEILVYLNRPGAAY